MNIVTMPVIRRLEWDDQAKSRINASTKRLSANQFE